MSDALSRIIEDLEEKAAQDGITSLTTVEAVFVSGNRTTREITKVINGSGGKKEAVVKYGPWAGVGFGMAAFMTYLRDYLGLGGN